jgi:hypothetical protein
MITAISDPYIYTTNAARNAILSTVAGMGPKDPPYLTGILVIWNDSGVNRAKGLFRSFVIVI